VEQKLKIRRNNIELIEIDNDKTPPVVMNMIDCAGLQYDWRLRLSRLNMTDFDLAKYDWRRREYGGGSGDYSYGPVIGLMNVSLASASAIQLSIFVSPFGVELRRAFLCKFPSSKDKLANIGVILNQYYDIGPRLNQH
jgi:hypothetical protein